MSAMPNLAISKIDIGTGDSRPELPMLRPTIGPPMADIRGLHKQAGCYAYDPALGETGICRSAITYVDGDNGVLLYRGHPIDDAGRDLQLSRSLLAADERGTAHRSPARSIHPRHQPSHDGERAAARDLPRLPARRPPDGGDVRGRRGVGGVLP